MRVKHGTRSAAALICLVLIIGVLCALSPAAAAQESGSEESESAGPAVTDVRAVPGGVQIIWESAEAAAKYAVYRRADDGPWVKYTIVAAVSYTDRNVSFGTLYTYAVRSLGPGGGYIGEMGEEKGILYGAAPELESVVSVDGGVRFTWAQSADAAGYAVYKKTEDGPWRKYTLTSGTSYTDRNVLPGMSYSYTVRSVDRNGIYMSGYDDAGLTVAYTVPPVLVSAANEGSGITVTWEAADGAAKYAVYRKPDGGSWVVYRKLKVLMKEIKDLNKWRDRLCEWIGRFSKDVTHL